MGTASQQTARVPRANSEGAVARAIETQTAKLPSDVFPRAAVGAMGVALALQLSGKKPASPFIGQSRSPVARARSSTVAR